MGCEECGFYWNHPDEDKPCPLCESMRLRERVRELERGIKEHKQFNLGWRRGVDMVLYRLIEKQERGGDE